MRIFLSLCLIPIDKIAKMKYNINNDNVPHKSMVILYRFSPDLRSEIGGIGNG